MQVINSPPEFEAFLDYSPVFRDNWKLRSQEGHFSESL